MILKDMDIIDRYHTTTSKAIHVGCTAEVQCICLSSNVRDCIGSVLGQFPDSKNHGANMGPIWGRYNPGGPHVGPINFAIWVVIFSSKYSNYKLPARHQAITYDD